MEEKKLGYKEINDEFDRLEVEPYFKLKAGIFSIIFAILLICGPVAILINLLIYVDIRPLLYLGIAMFTILAISVAEITYLRLVNRGRIKNISTIYILDIFIASFIILIALLLILELGVI